MPRYMDDTHILVAEYACPHCGLLPPAFRDEDGHIDIPYQVLFRAYEQIRADLGGKPLAIALGGGYRCLDYNQANYDKWLLGGKKGGVHAYTSVHQFGLALDIRADGALRQADIVNAAKKVTPNLRIGWKQYMKAGTLIVHIDYGQFIEPIYSAALVGGTEW